MSTQVIIRFVSGGAIVVDGEGQETIFGYDGDRISEVEGFAGLLRFLSEEYGPSTSRYSPERIYISVAPGDKFDSEIHDPRQVI